MKTYANGRESEECLMIGQKFCLCKIGWWSKKKVFVTGLVGFKQRKWRRKNAK